MGGLIRYLTRVIPDGLLLSIAHVRFTWFNKCKRFAGLNFKCKLEVELIIKNCQLFLGRGILFTVMIVVGCNQQTRKDTAVKMDSIKYPLLIDSGRKMVRELGRIEDGKWTVYLDTTTFTKGELYRQDSLRHPLLQFYLSYPEWKTISCIIAADERDYGDKAMIGLIEKTGKLRISYRGQKLYLLPTKKNTMKEGEWKGTFKSDSLEIQITGLLENKRILRSLTGFGELVLQTPSQTINEKIFMVYEKE